MERYDHPPVVRNWIKENWIKVSDINSGEYHEPKYHRHYTESKKDLSSVNKIMRWKKPGTTGQQTSQRYQFNWTNNGYSNQFNWTNDSYSNQFNWINNGYSNQFNWITCHYQINLIE